jgi:hypothetical protein
MLQVAAQPGIDGWSSAPTPAAMSQGPASAAVVFDGAHYVVVTANWASGLWQYVEPGPNGAPKPDSSSPGTNNGGGNNGGTNSGGSSHGGGGGNGGGGNGGGGNGGGGGANNGGGEGGGSPGNNGGAGGGDGGPAGDGTLGHSDGIDVASVQVGAGVKQSPQPQSSDQSPDTSPGPNLFDLHLDGSGGQLVNDRLTVSVPADEVASSGALLAVLALDASAAPGPTAGFSLGSTAFVVTLTDDATGVQRDELSIPITLDYRLARADLDLVGGDASRLRLAAWDDGSWVALPCSMGESDLTCTAPRLSLFALVAAPPPSDSLDYALDNGWFYKEANGFNGAGTGGYAVTDDASASLWSEFQRLGGIDELGYPISNRFQLDGCVAQAFQRGALEWQADQEQAVPIDILSLLSQRGLDAWLDALRHIPPSQSDPSTVADALSAYPPIGDFYAADSDALGLPLGAKSYGPLVSLRLEHAVVQYWTSGGSIDRMNLGDVAKEVGLWPSLALTPAPPPLLPPLD